MRAYINEIKNIFFFFSYSYNDLLCFGILVKLIDFFNIQHVNLSQEIPAWIILGIGKIKQIFHF